MSRAGQWRMAVLSGAQALPRVPCRGGATAHMPHPQRIVNRTVPADGHAAGRQMEVFRITALASQPSLFRLDLDRQRVWRIPSPAFH